jgi:hypothetical protein
MQRLYTVGAANQILDYFCVCYILFHVFTTKFKGLYNNSMSIEEDAQM